jgi:hypothetical protein
VLNLGTQSIRLRPKRVSQLDHVELAERFPETASVSQHLRTIDATLCIAHDWERFTLRRIPCADGNR